jgi:hypothetical protein
LRDCGTGMNKSILNLEFVLKINIDKWDIESIF